MSVPGGSLFWQAFEKRVIEHITKEHEKVKRLKLERNFFRSKFVQQRQVLMESLGEEHNRIDLCSICDDFFIENPVDFAFSCECGITVCDSCVDDGAIGECGQCEECYCRSCINRCHACEKEYCIACVPLNVLLWVDNTGNDLCHCKYHAYCSINCVPLDKRELLVQPFKEEGAAE